MWLHSPPSILGGRGITGMTNGNLAASDRWSRYPEGRSESRETGFCCIRVTHTYSARSVCAFPLPPLSACELAPFFCGINRKCKVSGNFPNECPIHIILVLRSAKTACKNSERSPTAGDGEPVSPALWTKPRGTLRSDRIINWSNCHHEVEGQDGKPAYGSREYDPG